jgi:two-component system, OmpR family, sensor kinase
MSSAGGTSRAWRSLRSLSDRTPLRVKLIAAVLALVAIALAVISVAGISVLKSYLLNQADDSLQTLVREEGFQGFSLNQPRYAPGEAVIWVPDSGQQQSVVIPVESSGYGLRSSPLTIPGPAIPADPASLPSTASHAITVAATSGGGRWRVVGLAASTTPNPIDGSTTRGTLVLATDVTSVYNTIGQLADLDLIVSGLLLFGILIVGFAVVRASLRPLTDIEHTAEGIAAGDLTRRVPDRDPRTEVGRLGRSLNAMLAQIETAFDARAQSEYAARRSEERMRQFVADASHELRTPLTAIRGYAEYYRQRGGVAGAPGRPALGNGADAGAHDATLAPRHASPGPGGEGPLARAELDRIMQRVEQESARMGVLVEDMLLLARLDQQRPLEQRTVDMLTLAADAVNDARVVAPGRDISLTVGSGAALLVLGDEVRLRQVVGNLMSNALNHTPDGTPIEVRVRSGQLDEWRQAAAGAGGTALAAAGPAGPASPPLPAVVLEIADQGPGLTPYQAEHVFERFYRADQARTRRAGGAGLGLAIVAALVAAHGGTVWVESPAGGGATFRIAIPLAPEARHIGPDPDDSTGPDILDSHDTLGSGTGARSLDDGRPAPPRERPTVPRQSPAPQPSQPPAPPLGQPPAPRPDSR